MDYTPYYETMRRTSLLRGMTDAELDTLMACFAPRVRRYAKGELLLMAGYETHEVGLVLEGAITASKPLADGSTVVMARMEPGGVFADVLAGLMEAKSRCDITISIDCDGQDDINAMDAMVDAYRDGCDVVYGVRSKRETDTFFKRFTAESFYKILNAMGAEVVFNHADYRLMSARVLEEFARFREVNLFLRGMVPLVGFKSTCVTYERHERMAGESHYPLSKMLALAFDGITSLSIKPIRFITGFGVFVALVSFIGVLWAVIEAALGLTVSGWASMTSIICFVSGVQLICLGVIGEYIGKIYLESKHRPRYIISDATPNFGEIKEDAQ